jgi:hypothetical protein
MSHSDYARIQAIHRFEDAWRRGQINRLRFGLTKKRKMLLPFTPIHRKLQYPSMVDKGIQEISVRNIVRSLAKTSEFDRDFCPLHKSQRNRWTNVWALHMQAGWEPIVVHQIDSLYFVEDGHHRTSVARNLGLETIEAVVTAYPVTISLDLNDAPAAVRG